MIKIYTVLLSVLINLTEAHLDALLLGSELLISKALKDISQGVVDDWRRQEYRHSIVFDLGQQGLIVVVHYVAEVHNRLSLPKS